MLDLVDLTSDVVLVRILLLQILDEGEVLLLNFSDGLAGAHQVCNEMSLDSARFVLHQSDILDLLVVMGAALLLLGLNLADDGIDLLA